MGICGWLCLRTSHKPLCICACMSVWVPWVGSDRGEQQKYLEARLLHLIPSRGLPGIAVDRQCITLNNVPSPLLNLYPGKFGAGTLKKTRSFPVNVCSAMGCSRLWT